MIAAERLPDVGRGAECAWIGQRVGRLRVSPRLPGPYAVSVDERDSGVTLAELLAAFSLATDLGLGQPMEHLLRS